MLDRYILAKLAALRDDLTATLDVCDISGACEQLRQFTEALTNWYVRRSRSRFWEEEPDAIDTLHTVLEVTARLAAPLLPLATEVIWRGLTGERSVHLTDWPSEGEVPADPDLVAAMDQVREVASVGSSLRKAKKLRVRLPLPKLTVAVEDPARLVPFTDLIADELNVKAVELTDDIDTYGRFELTVNARAAGPGLARPSRTRSRPSRRGGRGQPRRHLAAGDVVLTAEEHSPNPRAAEPEFTAALPDGAGPGCPTAPSPRSWKPKVGPRTASVSFRSGKSTGLDVRTESARRCRCLPNAPSGEGPRRPHRRGDPCHGFESSDAGRCRDRGPRPRIDLEGVTGLLTARRPGPTGRRT